MVDHARFVDDVLETAGSLSPAIIAHLLVHLLSAAFVGLDPIRWTL
jgi:hypothetical protein